MNQIRRILLPALAAAIALCFAACTPRAFKADAASVQKVQSVAVVGFDTYVSADISSKVNKLMGPDLLIQTLSSGWRPNVTSPIDSKDAYAALGDRLSSELGVRALSYDEVAGNPVYAEMARKHAYEHSVGTLRVDGILSGEGARKLNAEERASLRKALGVDALMTIELSYWVDDTDNVSEVGGEKLWGRIDAALFAEGDDAIWRDEADGERTKHGLPPFVHQEALANVRTAIEEATQNALNLLFSRLKGRCPDCCVRNPAPAPSAAEESPAASAEAAPVAEDGAAANAEAGAAETAAPAETGSSEVEASAADVPAATEAPAAESPAPADEAK